MDDTIDYSIVFAKTPKGVAEINSRSGALSLQARRVLIMIDGRRPVAELMAVVRTGEFDGIISTLETQNMIEKVDLSSLPTRDLEEEDFEDTISLLQENAAALRSVPHINPASLAPQSAAAQPVVPQTTVPPQTVVPQPVAPQTIQPRPATLGGTAQNLEGSADAAVIAARAVATASAPRPMGPPTVRRPATLSAALSGNDMPSGAARPGTLNGAMRVPEPVRQRPPTLTGARPATISAPIQEHAVAEAEPPARPAAPARAEPEQAPVAAPAPAAVPTRTLEEEKRFAVSELYSVLGPYGEQPVAKLQECSTMEALREQIKQAGKRVATFRGEKAAQDFLRTMGQA
jgi:hypothetical protein